jgi:sulfopyruvate decarboxylase subunit alpha
MVSRTSEDTGERVVSLVIGGLKEARVRFVVALPDSLLKNLYAAIPRDPDFRYVPVANEGEGAAVAAGAWAVGARSVLIMENSGLRSACEALARLGLAVGLPVTMLMGYRGEIGERHTYAVNHGMTMEPILNAMRIPYLMVSREEEVAPAVVRAVIHSATTLYHTAVVLRKPLV